VAPVETDEGSASFEDKVEVGGGIAVEFEVLDGELAGGNPEDTGKFEPLLLRGGASSSCGSLRSRWCRYEDGGNVAVVAMAKSLRGGENEKQRGV
jgi:hypothetical protein